MKRQQKYPDTKSFHFYNANPKGKFTGDCSIRAICTALGKPWEEVAVGMAEIACETGYSPCTSDCEDEYLARNGWVKMKQAKKSSGKKYTGKEFVKLNSKTTMVAHIGGHHTVCIKDGKVWDTWDSTEGCVGNYWIKGAK